MPLTAFQHVSKHAGVSLNESCPQWDEKATQENRKNGNFALFFDFLVPFFFDFGDIQSTIRENACNAV